jgi:hypothetical protein
MVEVLCNLGVEYPEEIPSKAKSLVANLLNTNPEARYKAWEAVDKWREIKW